jgi:hypothetical protein
MYRVYKKLIETPIPDDWDKETITSTTSFNKIIKTILLKASKIGTGSSRIAFNINQPGFENTTIKVAKNSKGLAQNDLEVDILSKDWYSDILPKLIDCDEESEVKKSKDSYLWLQVERATKVKKSDVKKYFGIKDFESFFQYFENRFGKGRFPISSQEDQDILSMSSWIETAESMIADYDLAWQDIVRVANLGMIDGRLVVIDVGASNSIIQSHYRKGWKLVR